MKKNNKFLEKNKIYLIIGSLFVLWVCFVFFVISPSIKKLKDNFDLVQIKVLDAQNNDSKLGKLNALRTDFEKVDKERGNLDVVFYKDGIVELVKDLEMIAQKTGNEIAISVDDDSKKIQTLGRNKPDSKENELLKLLPAENYFAIKISLVGNYNSLIEFVNKLNNIRYYNTVVSFSVDSKEIVLENTSQENDAANNGISVLNNSFYGGENQTEKEKKKLILNSELDVIFYSLEKNDGKK